VENKISKRQINILPNGILYLKGGDLKEELEEINRKATLYSISEVYDEAFYETKKVVYIPLF
jgi:16S rRNA (guanine527-N7)-methyltransferase